MNIVAPKRFMIAEYHQFTYTSYDKLLRMVTMLDNHFNIIDKQISEIKSLLSML